MSVPEAVALIEQANADGLAAVARSQATKDHLDALRNEVQRKAADLTCTVCGGTRFDDQISREDSHFGATSFPMTLEMCEQCGFVMQFSLGRSWYVPGN